MTEPCPCGGPLVVERDGTPVRRIHATTCVCRPHELSADCWCNPTVEYVSGASR